MKNPKQMYRHLLLALLTLTGISISQPLMATHIIGGELTYQYLGNNNYKVVLLLYRNCNDKNTDGSDVADIDQVSFIDIFDENGNQWPNMRHDTLWMPLIQTSVDTIPNNIAGDPCLIVPQGVCVEVARYEKVYRIPEPGGFYIVYQRCCRNWDILNIQQPDITGTTYWLYVSPLARSLSNSSPRFGAYPPVFVCVNRELSHPNQATDINGDSLAYKLYTPFIGAQENAAQPIPGPIPAGNGNIPIAPPPFTNVTWVNPPYNQNQMLGPGSNPLTVDVHSGLITALPHIQGRFVVGVLVEEYRNGELLSVVRRDFQYEVGECAKLDVQIIAPDAQCDDFEVHFQNGTAVAQNFVWYFDWPNPTPTSNQKEPTFTYPGPGNYTVALVAEPVGACVDTGFHEILLQLNSLTPDFSWNTYDCTNESVLVLEDLSVDTVSPIVSWHWEVNYGGTTLFSTLQNPVFEIPNPSSGTILLTVVSQNGCEQTKVVNFTSGGNNPLDHLDTVSVCLGEIAYLNPNGPTTGFTYAWGAPVPTSQQNLANPAVSPTVGTTYPVTINGYNNLCQSTGSVRVEVFQPVQLAFTPDTDCDATIVHFINQSQNAVSGVVWNFGDNTTLTDVSTLPNPTWDYPAFGNYTVTLMTPPNAVCKDTIQQSILLAQKTLDADFSYNYAGCEEGAVTVHFMDETDNSEDDTNTWLWTFEGVVNSTSTMMNPSIVVQQDGWLYVTLAVKTSENCVDTTATDSLYIDLTELPNLEDGSEVLGCLSSGVTLNPGGNTSYIYNWSPSTGLSCTNCASPHANPSQTTTYTATITNLNGADTCIISRSITVNVPPNINLVGSQDITTCDQTTTLSATVGLLPVDYAWFNSSGAQVGGDVDSLEVIVSGYESYVIRATDPVGCHYYDTVSVVGGPPNIESVGQQIKCSNEVLNIFARNLDLNDTLTWLWQPNPMITGPLNVSNPMVANLPGERWLYVTATNQFGCSATDSVYVAVVDTANVLDFEYVVSCNGSNVQFVNTSTDAFNFSWNFGDPTTAADTSHLDNPIYNYPSPGIYHVQLTMDFALACVDTLVKNVEIVSTQFVPDFTYEYLSCEADSVEVLFHDATIINQEGITADSFLWVTSNGDTSTLANPVFTIYEGETFLVTMTVYTSNGCDGTKTEELKLEFIEEYLDSTIVLCPGDSVAINPDGPTQYQYNWTPNQYISDPNAANPTVWPPQTTTYMVEITDFSPDTCSIIRVVTVFVPEKIVVNAQSDTITCGSPIQLCATANLQNVGFQWAILPDGFIGNGSCLTVFPTGDTEYEVTGTDQYGCTDQDTVFVADESVKLNWQNLGAECPATQVPLTVNNLVTDHNLTYTWSVQGNGQVLPPATGPSVTVVTPPAGAAANYTVTATNQHGCTASLTQSIFSHNFVPTVVDSLGVCPNVGEPINPGANANLMYAWSPASGLDCTNCPNPTVNISQSTNYTAIVTGNFGADVCKDTIGVEVFSAPIINITETADTLTCGEPVQISAQVNVPYQSIAWTNSNGDIVGNNVTSLTVEPADEETYTILVTDAYQCTELDTVIVANHELDLELTGGGVIDTCPMPSYNICIINLDPADLLEFSWTASNGGTILSGDMSACPEVTSQQGTTSVFIAEINNQWGCSRKDTFDITTFTFNPTIRESVVLCPEVPTPLNPAAANSTLDYYWSPSTGLSCTNCPNPTATLDQDQFYQVQILGYNGLDTCSFLQTVQVRVMPKINLTALPTDSLLCDTTDITLLANYTSNFVTNIAWSESLNFANPFATTASVTVSPDGTEMYYVQLTDSLGCKDTAQVSVLAYPVDISIAPSQNFCLDPGSLLIAVSNAHPEQSLSFEWTPQQFIETQNPDGSVLVSGLTDDQLFVVDAVNQYGCHDVDSTTVIFYDINATLAPSISSSMDTILYGSEEFSQLEIDFWPGYTYTWSPASGLNDPNIHNPQAKPDETTTYTVVVTDEGGCEATRSVTIYVWNPDCDEPNLFLPNAFTPNGDGENDELWLRSNIVVEMELAIYNRWGQRVFYTDEQPIKWNGAMNNEGEVLPPDAYGFYLRAKCYNGQEYFKKGNITLLR